MNQVDYVEESIRSMRACGIDVSDYGADAMRSLAHADDLSLFWIDNTAGKRAFIIARNSRFARHLAVRTGHILNIDNGQCFSPNATFIARNAGFVSAVQRAIKDREPGVIERKGNHAVLGEKVYSPLTAVR